MLPPSYYSIKIKSGFHFIRYVNAYLNASLLVFENIIEQYRREILHSKLMMVEGKLQVEGEVIHVIVNRCYDFSKLLRTLTPSNNENLPLLTLAYPDEKSIPSAQNKRSQGREIAQEKIFPGARNFK